MNIISIYRKSIRRYQRSELRYADKLEVYTQEKRKIVKANKSFKKKGLPLLKLKVKKPKKKTVYECIYEVSRKYSLDLPCEQVAKIARVMKVDPVDYRERLIPTKKKRKKKLKESKESLEGFTPIEMSFIKLKNWRKNK